MAFRRMEYVRLKNEREVAPEVLFRGDAARLSATGEGVLVGE